jgi:calcineurin-like phosphoesterase family protein
MAGQVYHTSDLHFGHARVASLRGFSSTALHDAAILAAIRNTLAKGDILWIHGDISLGKTKDVTYALERLNELTTWCDMHLIAGNHDPVHPLHRDAHKHQPEWLEVFSSVQPFARRRINGHTVWLSHFPWHGAGDRDGTEERHPEVRLHDNGRDWLLHGHLHSPTPYTGPRSFDVGMDAWNLRPVPLSLLERMIPRKTDQ